MTRDIMRVDGASFCALCVNNARQCAVVCVSSRVAATDQQILVAPIDRVTMSTTLVMPLARGAGRAGITWDEALPRVQEMRVAAVALHFSASGSLLRGRLALGVGR